MWGGHEPNRGHLADKQRFIQSPCCNVQFLVFKIDLNLFGML